MAADSTGGSPGFLSLLTNHMDDKTDPVNTNSDQGKSGLNRLGEGIANSFIQGASTLAGQPIPPSPLFKNTGKKSNSKDPQDIIADLEQPENLALTMPAPINANTINQNRASAQPTYGQGDVGARQRLSFPSQLGSPTPYTPPQVDIVPGLSLQPTMRNDSGGQGSGFGGGLSGGGGAAGPISLQQLMATDPFRNIAHPGYPVPHSELNVQGMPPTNEVVYSDKNLKTNISNTSKKDVNKFIKSIAKPKDYDYKDKTNGSQTKGGLMAQDLEKSKIGKSVVINTPKGKAIDTAKLAPILASVFSNKINNLENKLQQALDGKFKKKGK